MALRERSNNRKTTDINPTHKPQVGLISIGDAEVEEQKRDFEALIEGIRGFDAELTSKGIKAGADQIGRVVEELSSPALDVPVTAVLMGMNAQAIKIAAESTAQQSCKQSPKAIGHGYHGFSWIK